MSKIQQQQQPNSFIPGNAPTSVPAEYSITFDSINIPKDLMSLKNQPQAFVSHDEDFQLWNENEIVTHSMEKFVMVSSKRKRIVLFCHHCRRRDNFKIIAITSY